MANAPLFGHQTRAFNRTVNVWRTTPGKETDGTATFSEAALIDSGVRCLLWDTPVPNEMSPVGGQRELTLRNAPHASFALGQDVQTGDFLQETTTGLTEKWRITIGPASETKFPYGGGSLRFETAPARDPRDA